MSIHTPWPTPVLAAGLLAGLAQAMAPTPLQETALHGTWYCARQRGATVSELYYSGTPGGSWLRESGRQMQVRIETDGGHLFVTPMWPGAGQLRLGFDAEHDRLVGQWRLRAAREAARCARTEDALGWPLMLPGVPPYADRRPV